jgi:hypothetical protein
VIVNVVNKKSHVPTPYDEYVGRPSVLGNPYSHKKSKYVTRNCDTREEAVEKFVSYAKQEMIYDSKFRREVTRLADRLWLNGLLNLVCWCSPEACHAEVLKVYILGCASSQSDV